MTQATQQTDDSGELTKTEFFERIALEGVTLDGGFYMPAGEGRQRRYHLYDPAAVKGVSQVRGEDGEVVRGEVSNHDEAVVEQVSKSDIEDAVFPKVADGFGAFGLGAASTRPEPDEPDQADSGDGFEHMDMDAVGDTIRANFEEHGFFAEDGDGKTKVVSLAHPEAKLVGYVTGSHVKSLPNDLETVDEYRQVAASALRSADYGGLPHHVEPGDIPIATDAMMAVFKEAGSSMDEATKDRIAQQVRRRWEDGEYDHLRRDDPDEEA